MTQTTYSQRYGSGDSNTAGAFAFDSISSVDYAISKVAFGDASTITRVDASNPLPVTISGAATAANQTTGNTHLATIAGAVSGTEMQVDVLTMPTVTVQDGGGSITVDGTVAATQSGSWTVGVSGTVAVSAASLPLPSGAATAAKQPALGTAGAASSDVLTVQGIASMVALKVDGSAVTQPVSGTVSAAQSGTWTVQPGNTANTTAWLVTGTGGTFPITDSGGSITVDDGGTTLSIDDGGGAITVDGTVSLSGTVTVDSELTTADLDTGAGTDTRAVVGLVLAASGGGLLVGSANPMPISDNSGSITVDAPVGTPVFVRLSDGASAISTLPVSLASVPSHAVTNAGTFAVQVDGTALTRLTDIETNTDSCAVIGNGTAATAQRVTLANDSTGIVSLTTSTASIGKLAANSGVTIGAVEIASAQTLATVTTVTTVSTLTGGGVAHDGADSGNPVKVGGKAVTTQSGQTAVASGDRSDLIMDLDGTVISRPFANGDLVSGATSTTGTSDTSVISAQGASTYFYCTGFSISNTGSSTTLITFKDGSGGSTLWQTIAPTASGSNFSNGGKPLFRTSANTALHFACGTASTTVYVSVTGYKSKV